MHDFSPRTPRLYRLLVIVTLIISILAIYFPDWMDQYGTALVGLLILVIGVPHGVADCLIFRYSSSSKRSVQKVKFYASYLLLILVGILCLYLAPNAAISVFIAISAYHLGQAQLFYLSLPNSKLLKAFIYSCWGAFVIFAPIISNPEEVTEICSQFLGSTWVITLLDQPYLLRGILLLNFIILNILVQQHYLSKHDCIREIFNLLLLSSLFYTATLIVSFGIYFTLWHSLSSTFDQIKFVRQRHSTFSLKTFYSQVIPLTLLLGLLFVVAQFFLPEFGFRQSSTSLDLSGNKGE